MKLTVTVSGSLRAVLDQESIFMAGAVRRGVEAAGKQVQEQLRDQVRAAFRGGNSLAGAWRAQTYPKSAVPTLSPAVLVYARSQGRSNFVNIVDAFEQGVPIRAQSSKYLAWPTGFNAAQGRRGAGRRAGMRVTPLEMVQARGQAVVLATKRAGLKLWCLRVGEARGQSRSGRWNKNKIRLFVGARNVEILTGRIKAADRKAAAEQLLARGYVAMFFLARQVSPGKRLDVAGVFNRADVVLDTAIRAALAS